MWRAPVTLCEDKKILMTQNNNYMQAYLLKQLPEILLLKRLIKLINNTLKLELLNCVLHYFPSIGNQKERNKIEFDNTKIEESLYTALDRIQFLFD